MENRLRGKHGRRNTTQEAINGRGEGNRVKNTNRSDSGCASLVEPIRVVDGKSHDQMWSVKDSQ